MGAIDKNRWNDRTVPFRFNTHAVFVQIGQQWFIVLVEE